MSRATIIDGKAIAEALRREVAAGVAALKRERGVTPGLAVVLVGEDPASQVYVRTKGKAGEQTGMLSVEHKLPADTPGAALLALIGELNGRADVHGILVQLPLPAHRAEGHRGDRSGQMSTAFTRQHRAPGSGAKALAPCTPTGCDPGQIGDQARGAEAVVIGRSTSSASRWRSCCQQTAPSRSPTRAPAICRPWCVAPTWWWRRSAGRRW
jgi:methylenetetrahydrofolate dehydrogenase (NADP+)/methenyltetrahydrofolate cyclohydrolase